MLYTVDWVARNYEKYNQLIWGGALPPFSSVNLSFTKSKSRWGEAGCARWLRDNNNIPYATHPVLKLSNYYDSPEDVKLNTLVHEMCHLYEYFCESEYIVKAVMTRRYTAEYPRDGHGKVFNEQAKRIKDICGIEITRFVKSSEVESSDLSDNVRERYLKKIKKLNGIDIFLLRLNGSKAPYGYVKVESEDVKNRWMEFFTSERCKPYVNTVVLYKTFNVNCINLPTSKLSRRLTWYLLNDASKFINDYDLKLEEVLLGDEKVFGSSNKAVSTPSEKRYKLFTLKFTNGTILKYDNVTKSEVAERLHKVFPKWSSDIVNKFVNDEKLYTENMKKDNLDILIERVLRNGIDNIINNENEISVSDEDMEILNNNFLTTIN